jgi:hypothetical protein
MVAAVAFALTPPRRRARLGVARPDGTIRKPQAAPRPKPGGSFMHRLEERWDRRRDQY